MKPQYYTEVPGYIFNKNPKREERLCSTFACRVLRSEFPLFFFTSRKRQRDKDSIIWDDGLYMEPTFTKLDTDESAYSTYNPIYNLNGGKLEIDSTQAH